jgi:hypothetical protein
MTKTKTKNEKKEFCGFLLFPLIRPNNSPISGNSLFLSKTFFCSKTFFYKCDLSKTLSRFENKTNGRSDKNYNENGNKRQKTKKKKFEGAKS